MPDIHNSPNATSQNSSHPAAILDFVLKKESAVLCILTDVSGGTLRRQGAMMAVTAADSLGYMSNGCVDGDILFQAREALKDGMPRYLRYGEGSPFKDITLPCGGRIDIAVLPSPPRSVIQAALSDLDKRQATQMSLTHDGRLITGVEGKKFNCTYNPPLRLRIAGRGEAALQLALQARAAGFDVILQSPDCDLLGQAFGTAGVHLRDPANIPMVADDGWTAIAFLFHDHEWEINLLKQALKGAAFYIGAMGSEKTHRARALTLMQSGASEGSIARIHGPIGLIPAMRDANLLALSILAEVITEAEKAALI